MSAAAEFGYLHARVSVLAERLLPAQRLYDLIRFGVAETVMAAFSLKPEPGFEFKPTALLLPIPRREINLYPALQQNPGY